MENINLAERISRLKELGLEVNSDGVYERKDVILGESQVTGFSNADFDNLINDIKAYMLANPTLYPLAAEPTQELTIIDRAKDTLLSGGQVLQRNQQKAAIYVKASNELKAAIEANGGKLNAELDVKANNAIIKLDIAVKEVDEDTKPIRQAMTFIRDELLACKNNIQSERDIIQKYRNQWAIEVEAERKRVAEEERQAAAKRQEVITLKAEVEKSLQKYFYDYLAAKKLGTNTWFNAITLDTFEKSSATLHASEPKYDLIHYKTFIFQYTGSILKGEEITEVINSVKTDDKFNEFSSIYFDEMITLKNEKIDLLSSKKNELERIAEFEREQEEERKQLEAIEQEKKTADEARQKELQELQRQAEARQQEARQKELEELEAKRQREEEEKARNDEENRIALAAQNTKVDVVAAQESTISMYVQTANSTPVAGNTKIKTALKATITNVIGVYPIFQLWFENVGIKMTIEELMDKLDFMFTHASKEANKAKAPLQIENEFVAYVEDTKAVTTKDKKKKEGAEL